MTESDEDSPPTDPWLRLRRASELARDYLARTRADAAEPIEEFLAAHEDLRELIAPLVAAGPPTSASASTGGPPEPPISLVGPPDDDLPDRIGRFEIRERLGRGGMGEVFEAYDPQLAREVALKVVRWGRMDRSELLQRFKIEAQVSARLDHPGICEVYDFGVEGEDPYLVMQLIDGISLDKALEKRGRPANSEQELHGVAELIADLAEALEHAHARDVLHRDLKPSNVMIRSDGKPVVLDFGLARDLTTEAGPTLSGQGAGTPLYMAPEQVDRQTASARTDVWGLGNLLYECITGRPTFGPAKDRIADIFQRIRFERIRPLTESGSQPSADLQVIVETALQKVPQHRYPSAGAMAEDLRRYTSYQPIRARRPTVTTRLARWSRRNRLAAALMGALVVALGVATVLGIKATREADRAFESDIAASAAQTITLKQQADALFERGAWLEADNIYAQAQERGYLDPIEILIRRIEILMAVFETSKAYADIDELVQRPHLDRHMAKVLLLSGDRTRAGDSKWFPPKAVRRKQVRAALDAAAPDEEGLTAADQAYAQALLAEQPEDILSHLRTALDLVPWHRPASEMLVSALLLGGRLAEAESAARLFRRQFPLDAGGGLMVATCLASAGRFEEARIELGNGGARDEGVRTAFESWSQLFEAFRMVLPWQREMIARKTFGLDVPVDRQTDLVVAMLKAVLSSQSPAKVVEVLGRVHPVHATNMSQLLSATYRVYAMKQTASVRETLSHLAAQCEDGLIQYLNGITAAVDGDHVLAAREFFDAEDRPSLFNHRDTCLVLGFWTAGQAMADPTTPESTRDEMVELARSHLDAVLAVPGLTELDYRLLHHAARALPKHIAPEIALRWARHHPTDPQAARAMEAVFPPPPIDATEASAKKPKRGG